MFKKIAITVVILIAAVLGYAATKPDTFRYERQVTINAPASVIFPMLNNFKNWMLWSPYEKKDPDMKRTYGGAEAGVGATYAWEGDSNIGAGVMEIKESKPDTHLLVQLLFTAPMEGNNTAEFTLTPQGDATVVKWAMYGPNTFPAKLAGLVMDIDKMVGNDFEAGLADLKAVAEKTTAEAKAVTAPLNEPSPAPTQPVTPQ
jgi:uncharacterized membrane protein